MSTNDQSQKILKALKHFKNLNVEERLDYIENIKKKLQVSNGKPKYDLSSVLQASWDLVSGGVRCWSQLCFCVG